MLVALLAGPLVACTAVKDATKSGPPALLRTTTVPGETVEPSETELRAIIEVPATLPSGEAVNLRFTLTNNTDTRLYVLEWYTPLEGLAGEIFRVERDGQVIPYQGILAYRDAPPPDAYVLLDAGESVSAEVDLATAYDFSEAGEYTIAFISPRISHIARSETEMAKTVDDLGPVQIPSNRVTVEIGGSSKPKSMKGYELYSWQTQREWYFALVVGTNRIKTYEEISSPGVRVQGLETLKSELDKLSSGEQVFWSTQWVSNTTLPPGETIDEIRTYCIQRGIKLEIEPPQQSDSNLSGCRQRTVSEERASLSYEAEPQGVRSFPTVASFVAQLGQIANSYRIELSQPRGSR
jgi:hypothetical protein